MQSSNGASRLQKNWQVMMHDIVRWGRVEIPYTYRLSKRKTLAINVHPDLAVEVVAPLETPLEVIRTRVAKRGAWIQKAWREFELYPDGRLETQVKRIQGNHFTPDFNISGY